jgi:hypothetical protein
MFSNEPATVTPGGRAVKYYSSLELRLERRSLLTDPMKNYQPYGSVIKVKVMKSSVGEPFNTCYVYNHRRNGFDNAKSVMWFLAEHGVLQKQAGKPSVYKCEHFRVVGLVAGKKLKKIQLDLSNAQSLYDKYGWEALSAPIRKEFETRD